MKNWKAALCLLLILCACRMPQAEAAVGIANEKALVGDEAIDVMIYKEWSEKPRPLLVINHGGSTESELQLGFRAFNFDAQATFLAEQGYVVALPTRRGYGRSLSKYREWDFKSYNPKLAAENGTQDVLAAIRHMQRKEYVDRNKVVVMGYSFGGFLAVAAAASNIEGVIGAVSFSGGTRSSSGGVFDETNAGPLFACYKDFGAKTKVPELWLYSRSDNWYPQYFVQGMHKNFSAGGAKVELVILEGRRDFFLRAEQIPLWWKHLQPYLKKIGI